MKPYLTDEVETGDVIVVPEFEYCICNYEIVWDEKKKKNVVVLDKKDLQIDKYQEKSHPIIYTARYTPRGKSVDETFDVAKKYKNE